jgi:predicted GIY-YIG superfamily endonuclease
MPCEASAKQGRMHYVYLIESIPTEGKRYVGYTDNLPLRIAAHNAGKNVGTARHRPWRLRTYLAFSNKLQALAFERYLKSGSGHAFANKRLWRAASLARSG